MDKRIRVIGVARVKSPQRKQVAVEVKVIVLGYWTRTFYWDEKKQNFEEVSRGFYGGVYDEDRCRIPEALYQEMLAMVGKIFLQNRRENRLLEKQIDLFPQKQGKER